MSDDKQLPATTEQKPITQLPFAPPNQELTRASERIEMERAKAEVNGSFQMALYKPRDEEKCYDRIMKLCTNIGFASDALYRVPRGNEKVEGIGIGAATEIGRIWGNIRTGKITHGVYDDQGQFEAFSYDIDNNYWSISRFSVSFAKNDKPTRKDEVCKAAASKEKRNCILELIPRWVRDDIIKECKRTLHRTCSDVPEAFKIVAGLFAKVGVEEKSIWRYINRKPDKDDTYKNVTVDDIVDLRVLFASIKEHPNVLDEEFPERKKKKGEDVATELPKSNATEKDPAPASAAAETQDSQDTSSAASATSANTVENPEPPKSAPSAESSEASASSKSTDTQSGASGESAQAAPTATDDTTPPAGSETTNTGLKPANLRDTF